MPYKMVERVCPGCGQKKTYTIAQVTCLGCPGRAAKAAAPPGTTSDREHHLRKEVSRLLQENGKLRDSHELLREIADRVADVVPTLPKPPAWRPPARRKAAHSFPAVLKLSDHHIGEVISPTETSGFGEYNWGIAQRRLFTIVDKFVNFVETQRTNFDIPELVVLAEGDFISGDIHRELSVTNEFPVPVQIAKAGWLLGTAVSRLAQVFPRVRLVEVGGDNHGRFQPMPQAKQKGINNATYMVYTLANQMLAAHSNVKTELHEAFQARVEIGGKFFLVEHGDNLPPSSLGTPYYSMSRHKGREAQRRMLNGLGFDYLSIGHYHVPAIVEGNILVNGSLSGTSEYDHALARHAPPAQVSFLVHPKWGIFYWTAWQVE